MPILIRMQQGISICVNPESRQIAPSKARIAQRNTLKLLNVSIHPFIATSGIIPPPSMAIMTTTAQAAPPAAASVLPNTENSIIMPMIPVDIHIMPIIKSGSDVGCTPKTTLAISSNTAATVVVDMKHASPLPANICQ